MKISEVFFRNERALRGYARKNKLDIYSHRNGWATFGGHRVPALGVMSCGCGETAGAMAETPDGWVKLILCEHCYAAVSSMERGH